MCKCVSCEKIKPLGYCSLCTEDKICNDCFNEEHAFDCGCIEYPDWEEGDF